MQTYIWYTISKVYTLFNRGCSKCSLLPNILTNQDFVEPHDSLTILCWDATGVLRKVVCKPRCWRLLVAFTPSWCSQHGMHGKHIMRRKFGEDFTRPHFPGRDGSEIVRKLDKLPRKLFNYSTSMGVQGSECGVMWSHMQLSSKPQGFPLYKPV